MTRKKHELSSLTVLVRALLQKEIEVERFGILSGAMKNKILCEKRIHTNRKNLFKL